MMSETRLDEALVMRGLYLSRSRARDAILRGTVMVDGLVATKVSRAVSSTCVISVSDPAQSYVSRAALKLIAGLDGFDLTPDGLNALDIGSSTGGFIEVLLGRGAAHVTGVDVGHGQLHPGLANDSRVTNLENLNSRDLARDHIGEQAVGFVTCDVSFISLVLAMPPALALAEQGASCVLLVKPQFEAGREAVGKGGLLKDPSSGLLIAGKMSRWLDNQPGWRSIGVLPSPVAGGDGNHEFLLGGVKDR